MALSFIEAAFPESFTILGHVLRPFSLGHSITLRRFDCAFMTGGDAYVQDLLLGIIVCSKTFEEGCKFFSDTRWPDRVFELGESLHKPTGALWWKKNPVIDWDEKMRLFGRYVDIGRKEPVIHYENGGAKSGIPWEEHMIQVMMKLGHKESEVYDMHLPKLQIRYITHLENASQGSIRFQTEDDRQMLAHVERMTAEFNSRTSGAAHG